MHMPPAQPHAPNCASSRTSNHAAAFARWHAAADGADAAEQEFRAALRSNLFVSNPEAFEELAIKAQVLSAIADKELETAVAALIEQA